MAIYARHTKVAVERTESEIKKMILRYGGDEVIIGTSQSSSQAVVQFTFKSRHYRLAIKLPNFHDTSFQQTPTGRARVLDAARREHEQACRQKWRVLALLLKAQLEAIHEGILSPEEAFMTWLMLPNGETVGEATKPHLDKLLQGREAIKSLPFFSGGKD